MKILYGVEQPDAGVIYIGGEQVHLRSPRTAIKHGIGMVFQHFGLVPGLTAAENIALGSEPTRYLQLDRTKLQQTASALAERFQLPVKLDQPVKEMSAARQQRVEILKALYRGARILILDEPTALLTPQERQGLFEAIRHLTDAGATVVFVTHKLSEVEELADEITVMRGGIVAASGATSEFSTEVLVELMIGRNLASQRRPAAATGETALDAREVTVLGRRNAVVDNVSLEVREGELLALVGVEGNGQLEALETFAGLHRPQSGRLLIGGAEVVEYSNRAIRRLGVGYVPEDRLAAGVAAAASIADNLAANRLGDASFSRGGVLNISAIRDEARRLVREFDVRCASIDQAAGTLSGGNIQKLILARELAPEPKLLLVAEPTRGLDVGAAENVHEQLRIAANRGAAIAFISSDLDEVRELATRVCVFFRGRIVAEFADPSDVPAAEIGSFMLGTAAALRSAT